MIKIIKESKDRDISRVLAYMSSLGVSIEEIKDYKKPTLGKFREFSDNDYREYSAENLPNGLKPLIYRSDKLDLIISGNEDDDNAYVLSAIQENVESYKIYDNFDNMIKFANSLISKLESTDNIDEVLIDNGFKAV